MFFFNICVDIKSEKAIKISNINGVKMRKHIDTLKYFVDNHSDLIIIFDRNYKILFLNEAYCQIFAKNYNELKGKDFLSLMVEGDREKAINSIQKIDLNRNSTTHSECILSADGIKWIEWKVKGRFSSNGKLLDYFSVGRDITELKQMQEELEINKSRHETAELIGGVGNWEYNIITDFHSDLIF